MDSNSWVSVEESLPGGGNKKYGVDVLAIILHYSTNGNARRTIKIVTFKDLFWWHSPSIQIGGKVFQKVTHWMYLPAYPKKHKPFKIKELSI